MKRTTSTKTTGHEAYAVEIPSREEMLEVLNNEGVPVDEERLRELLSVSDEQREGFERRLAAMEREGQVHRNRRGRPQASGTRIRRDGR